MLILVDKLKLHRLIYDLSICAKHVINPATLEMLWFTLPQNYTKEHQLGRGPGLDSAQLMVFVNAGHDDASTPTGDTSAGLNQPHDETKTNKPINVSSSNYWRDVKANLVRREQVSLGCS